jgi:hypothetical protein
MKQLARHETPLSVLEGPAHDRWEAHVNMEIALRYVVKLQTIYSIIMITNPPTSTCILPNPRARFHPFEHILSNTKDSNALYEWYQN